ncbi:MAG: hypothetical protein V4598_18160 [Bdellovibrionota bacterium]
MHARALMHSSFSDINETEIFARIQLELVNRYGIDEKLASEMAWDFLEVLSAVDGNIDIFDKYFLQ